MKSIEQLMRTDKRRLRAQSMTAAIMHIVGKYVSDEDQRRDALRDLSRELFDHMWKEGVEIVTDEDRRMAGLPPRGADGWTFEEIAILEQRRLEIMRAPMPPVILSDVKR